MGAFPRVMWQRQASLYLALCVPGQGSSLAPLAFVKVVVSVPGIQHLVDLCPRMELREGADEQGCHGNQGASTECPPWGLLRGHPSLFPL